MKDFFATCSKPGKFQWESDQQINGGPKYHEPRQEQTGEQDYNQDPFGPGDMTDPNAVSSHRDIRDGGLIDRLT